jgi:AraC family transcriptional regulator
MGAILKPGSVALTMDAELNLPVASVRFVQFELFTPVDNFMRNDEVYRLDLSLTPRLPNTRLRYSDSWDAQRFESPGRLFLQPPGQTLHMKSEAGHQGIIICELSVPLLNTWLEAEFEWTNPRLEASLNIASSTIKNLLLQLGREARYPGFASEMMSEGLALQIAANLQRYYHDIGSKSLGAEAVGGLALWRLRLIDERLGDMEKAPTLQELATLCTLSVRQLSRGFRASRGIAIGEYVAQKRIDKAKLLLAKGESVKAVSYTMGFASPSSFSYAFRKASGMAPGQYRQVSSGR